MPLNQVNAWILLSEDEPAGTFYADPASCFQTLIDNKICRSVDMVFICFAQIVSTSTPGAIHVVDGHTLQTNNNPTHPRSLSDTDYMRTLIADAKRINPEIKFLITLDPASRPDQISQIFTGCTSRQEMEDRATAFAKNAIASLQAFGLQGFEIDWERPLADPSNTSQEQFECLARAVRAEFANDYMFVMNTATTDSLTGDIVNGTLDFLTLQLYSHMITADEFLALGVDKSKLAYGATFEAWPGRQQTPDAAAAEARAGGYTSATQWRLNSGNFQQEQEGQVKFYALCKG